MPGRVLGLTENWSLFFLLCEQRKLGLYTAGRDQQEREVLYQVLYQAEIRQGPREVKLEPSAQISKSEPRLYRCTAPESASKSPTFSQGGIARAWSSHPNGQYFSGLFWKLGKVKHSTPENGSHCRTQHHTYSSKSSSSRGSP